MRVLSTIVEPFVLPMLHSWQYLAFRSPIPLQFVSNDHARHVLRPFEQFPKESLGGPFVASALHQDIKHVAILINGSPYTETFVVCGGGVCFHEATLAHCSVLSPS
jgi:hypothetical protein